MPYLYSVVPENRLAHIRMRDTVHGHEIAEAWRDVVTDPAWQVGFGTLWDVTEITLILDMADVEQFAEAAPELSSRRGPGRTAVVVDHPDVHLSALLLCLKSQGKGKRSFRIFDRMEDAVQWLALEATAEDGDTVCTGSQWTYVGGELMRVPA
jgi:hypothetical protein